MSIKIAKHLAWIILLSKENNFREARSKIQSFYSKSRAIEDFKVNNHLLSLPTAIELLKDKNSTIKFQEKFLKWIQQNKFNSCIGLEKFEADISQGATQSFDSFFVKYPNKKHKFFLGEYLYHIVVKKNLKQSWSFISNYQELESGDTLILSVPFCDSGNAPKNLTEILQHCEKYEIPVLLDLSYYTISHGIKIDLNYNCIDTVVFSLSKTFPVAHARIGMRFTRESHMDGQKLHSKINYNNNLSAGIGLHIIEKFSSDYVVNEYIDFYNKIIKKLNLIPGQTVIFATGDDDWSLYGRKEILKAYGLQDDSKYYKNRICVTELLENREIVERILND